MLLNIHCYACSHDYKLDKNDAEEMLCPNCDTYSASSETIYGDTLINCYTQLSAWITENSISFIDSVRSEYFRNEHILIIQYHD
jgi:hypothetical protein